MRQVRTSDLIFSVLRIVAKLAAILPLPPGDLIFTGTPSGVGGARKSPVYLRGERRALHARSQGSCRSSHAPTRFSGSLSRGRWRNKLDQIILRTETVATPPRPGSPPSACARYV
jgi:2-keto-4-pentenoate hydratase/2-oxohepta-3-ene-1,7-dioic acid hydratase in catechol pathway